MSDEPIHPSEDPPRKPIGVWEHWCEHDGCKTWGSFGYRAGKSQPQHWFCRDHRTDGERIIGR